MQIKLICTRKVVHLASFNKSECFWNLEVAYLIRIIMVHMSQHRPPSPEPNFVLLPLLLQSPSRGRMKCKLPKNFCVGG